MATLLIADHDNRTLSEATARAATAAAALGEPITLLVAGEDCRAIAEAGARLAGVTAVRLVEAPHLRHQLAEPLAALVAAEAAGFTAVVAPATSTGKNVLPRVAALLDVMQVSDVTAVVAPDTFERPVYAGSAIETVRTRDTVCVLTIRASAFPPAGEQAPAEIVAGAAPDDPGLSTFDGEILSESERPDLAAARIIISGGRALGSKEAFEKYLEPLATKLGAAIGASRAAVDSGYAANDLQVGQTGKVVAPDLYIAIGISGAIQHLAGMKDSRVIVAINKDAEAPIFQMADYGLVGDLFQILPELQDKL